MHLRNTSLTFLVGFSIFLSRLLYAQDSASSGTIKVGETALGNVVAPSPAPVSLPLELSGPADGLKWELFNGWNVQITEDHAPLVAGEAKTHIDVVLATPGLYVLKIHLLSGGKVIAETTTNLAALTPYDLNQVKDSPFGVDTHYGQSWDHDSIPLLATMGAKFLRDGLDWDRVENEKKGVMKVADSYQQAVDIAATQHLNFIHVLAYGNMFYYPDQSVPPYQAAPYTQEGYDQFARYCTFMVDHFRDEPEFFEMWNEYNGGFAQGVAAGRPEIYAAMIKTVYPAIKKANPKAFVLGLSTIGIPMTWIEEAFKHGALDYMDGVSIHPYTYTSPPEPIEDSLIQLRALMRKYNHGEEKPIWVTEDGWYLIKAGDQGNREPITEFTQAEYLVRGWTLMLGQHLRKICWYVGHNFGDYPTMGLLTSDNDPRGRYAPKLDYVAYATLIRQLTGYSLSQREKSPQHIYDYLFANGTSQRRVLWATRPDDIALIGHRPVTVTDMLGGETTLYPVNRTLNFHVTQAPVYITGPADGLASAPLFRLQIPTTLAKDQSFPATVSAPTKALAALHDLTFVYGPQNQKLDFEAHAKSRSTGTLQLAPRPSVDEEAWTPLRLVTDGKAVFIGSHHALLSDAVTADHFPRLKSLEVLQESVANVSQEEPATVQRVDYEIDGKTNTLSPAQQIAPGETFDFQLPTTNLQPFTLYPVTITLTLANGTRISRKSDVSYNPVMRRTIKVDGSLDDWDLSHGIDMDTASYVKLLEDRHGPKDLGGHIYFAADNQDLYMAAIVEDDVFSQDYTGSNVWRGDSVQIGITSLAPWIGGEWPAGQQEFELALTSKGPQMLEWGKDQLPGVKIAIKRKGTQTIYEAALPWTALYGIKGPLSQFSWGVFINDNDGHGRKGYLQWGDIKSLNGMQPFYFNIKPQP